MRVVLVAASITALGCGRIAFDPLDDAGGGGDGGVDMSNARCSARQVMGFDLGRSDIRDVAVAKMPDGFALGFLGTPSSRLMGLHVDPSLVPNTSTPWDTSPPPGDLTTKYVRISLRWDGTTLVGAATYNMPLTMSLKTFTSDMMTFVFAGGHSAATGEHSTASAGSTSVSTYFNATQLFACSLDGAGISIGNDAVISTNGLGIVDVDVAGGDVGVAVITGGDGNCNIAAIADDLSTTTVGFEPGCSHAHVLGGSGLAFAVAYERTTGAIGLVEVTTMTVPINLTYGSERDLVTGTNPRLMRIGSERWLAWNVGATFHLGTIDPTLSEQGITGLPPGTPTAWEVEDDHVFLTFGSSVWAVTCP